MDIVDQNLTRSGGGAGGISKIMLLKVVSK